MWLKFKQFVINNRWGGQCLISLYISILSGIVIALQYDVAAPFHSTLNIELLAPFGSFWHSLHFYSSQIFFLLLIAHFIAVIWKGELNFSRMAWIRLTASLPIALMLLFTGYILRGDATGMSAGKIAEHIVLSIPWAGDLLNKLFFDLSKNGAHKVYVHHIIGFVVLGTISIWPHIRRYPAYLHNHILLMFLITMSALIIKAPMEPEKIGTTFITGPWFFLGLQELLRYLPVFIAGVIAPLTLVAALFFFPLEKGKEQKIYIFFILLWLCINAVLSWLCYHRL